MTPFTVNLALTDSESLDLSHIIHPRFQEKSDWSAALRQSEAKHRCFESAYTCPYGS